MECELKRKSVIKSRKFKESTKGLVLLMCDHCHHLNEFNMDISMKSKSKDVDTISLSAYVDYHCCHCHKRNVHDIYKNAIDPNIAVTIENLNIAGYKTYHSCEGDNCSAYISFGRLFEDTLTPSKIFSICDDVYNMKNWFVDQEDFHMYKKLIIRANAGADMDEALKEIYEWSNKLACAVDQ